MGVPTRVPRRFWLTLGGIVLVVGLFIGHWALSAWTFQTDEILYRDAARWFVDNLPGSLWSQDGYGRGVQRMNSWVLGASLAAFGSPTGFVVARWLFIAAYCSTSIPVAVWALRLRASSGAAFLAALFSVIVPWGVITSTFLTESLAYPAFVWAAFAIWHAAVRRGARADLLALGAVSVAALSRSGLLVLFAVLPLVALAVELRVARGPGMGWLPALRRGAVTFVRGHTLLLATMVIGLTVVVVGGGQGLRGSYDGGGLGWMGWTAVWDAVTGGGAVLAVGLAFVPVAVGAAFCARQVLRPGDRAMLALALVTLFTALALVWSRTVAGTDERYLMYLAPLLLVCTAVGLSRREFRWPAVAIAGAAAIGVVLAAHWGDIGPFGFVSFPTTTFTARVLGLTLAERLPGSPDAAVVAAFIGAAAVVATIVACVVADRRRRIVLGTVAVAVGVMMAAQLGYSLQHFARATGGPALDDRAWLDRAVGSDATIGVFAPTTTGADVAPFLTDLRYYNESARVVLRYTGGSAGAGKSLRETDVTVDPRTGRLIAADGGPVPSPILVPRTAVAAPLAGRVIGRSPTGPVDLLAVGPSARVAYRLAGADGDGWIRQGDTATVRVFPAPARAMRRCVDLRILRSPDGPAAVRYTVRSGAVRRSGISRGATPDVITVPLAASPSPPTQIRVVREGPPLPPGGLRLYVGVDLPRPCG